ncbi:MAG TPA: winged helix DNA-binding domain-containing protein [Dehalococcoidia bacterium]
MPRTLTARRLRLLRLRAQRLGPRPADRAPSVVEAVRDACGVQAQDAAAAALGVRARTTGLTAAGVERALREERTVVRTWCLRSTLHLVAAEDLHWLLPLTGPVFLARGRRRRLQLELDDEACDRGLRALRRELSRGPLTRAELRSRLAAEGIPAEGQALPHLLLYAALLGQICEGPGTAREPAYVLLEDWLGPLQSPGRETALRELACRYVAAYGPAGPEDLAAWSGLPSGDVRTAWRLAAPDLVEVEADGRAAWVTGEAAERLEDPEPQEPSAQLLPAFDAYLLGYRDRDFALPAAHAARILPGGGMIHPAALADGRAVGTWRHRRGADGLEVTLEPFEALPAAARAALAAEAADVGRFLGLPAEVRTAASAE